MWGWGGDFNKKARNFCVSLRAERKLGQMEEETEVLTCCILSPEGQREERTPMGTFLLGSLRWYRKEI